MHVMPSILNFDYDIKVKEINPPIGGVFKYGATVDVLTQHGKNVRFHQPKLGEYHGKTKAEAIEKLEDEILKWIKRFQARK